MRRDFLATASTMAGAGLPLPGAHTGTRSKNYALVYHLLEGYFSQPASVYTGV